MIKIPHELLLKIEKHVEDMYPEEGVGLLLGRFDDLERIALENLPVENTFVAGSRRRRYQINPLDMLQAEEIADSLGLQLVGVYHSHPDHPPIASETDLAWAVPWYSYLITSVRDGKAMTSRCWRLDESSQVMIEEEINILSKQEEIL